MPDSPPSKTARLKPQSRREQGNTELPLCVFHHVITYLLEIGPTNKDGAISYSEIATWQQLSGIILNPWEARTIRILSKEYLNESYAARDPARPAPYLVINEKTRDKVARQMKSALSGRTKQC